MPRSLQLLLLLAVVGATAAAAQGRPDSTGLLRGAVFDSLITGGPLVNAEVWLEGTNRSARTDARGRFEFSGLPSGRYTLTFYHVVLDSTGFSAKPVTINLEPGRPEFAVLTTPGPRVLHRALCPQDPLQRSGVVLGLVRDAAGGKLLADASVTAEWTLFVPGSEGNRWEPRSVATRSDRAGRVVLCAVPTDVTVLVRGQAAGGPVGILAIDLAGREFGRANLELASSPATGSVIGVLRRRDGEVITNGIVQALGTDSRVAVDAQGRFALTHVPAGSQILEARSIGYPPTQAQVSVPAGGSRRVEFIFSDSVYVLPPVTVTGTSYLTQVGFERRRKSAQGHYLDQKDIARTAATRFEEVFRLVPGVRLRPSGMGFIVEMQRGQGQIFNPSLRNYCQPSYFIDGQHFPLPPNETRTLPLVPSEVLAIEIYSNVFSAPLQYQRRDGGCGVILVWTKRGIPNRPE